LEGWTDGVKTTVAVGDVWCPRRRAKPRTRCPWKVPWPSRLDMADLEMTAHSLEEPPPATVADRCGEFPRCCHRFSRTAPQKGEEGAANDDVPPRDGPAWHHRVIMDRMDDGHPASSSSLHRRPPRRGRVLVTVAVLGVLATATVVLAQQLTPHFPAW